MSLHKEIRFELEICHHLPQNGWLYSETGTEGDAAGYDRARALFPADQEPRRQGQAPEPRLSFPAGALVHFAVSNSEVHMVIQLNGQATLFLPFNLGNAGGAGNPVNPAGGHRTAYLWEQVWARASWLEILGRYLMAQRDKKKQIARILFPRFHTLDVTRKLQVAVLADGPGGKYLIQHSAGFGKTNSIAWTAHFLAELHDAENRKVFDTVLVVSDRNVIDAQLQEALFDFQRTTGVVATIKNTDGSKSTALAEALSGDKKIEVCTIQTFPFALEAVRKLAATQGKRFAVIADEAHSSQTGEAASKLKALLSPEELQELNDGGEVSSEDIQAAQVALKLAQAKQDDKAGRAAQEELDALVLFKGDMGAYLRLYTFLSQIFDYGNTAIEKRTLFYKRLLPLLEFGRERSGMDLSKVLLTHHHLKNRGTAAMPPDQGDTPKLAPLTEAGSGSVQEKAWLLEIIEKVNDLFDRRPDRPEQAGLCEQGAQGQAAGIANAAPAGEQQQQGAVCQLARPEDLAA